MSQLAAANSQFVFIHLAGNEQQGKATGRGAFGRKTQTQLAGVATTVLDFGLASGSNSNPYNTVTVPAGKHLILILNWNDPPHGVANRALTAHLLDENLQELSHASGESDPTLRLDYTNTGSVDQVVNLAVSLDSGSATGLAVQVNEGSPTCNIACQSLTYSTSGLAGGSIGDFDDALVVGATRASSPHILEPWSNHGPFRIDFTASPDSSAPDGFDYTRLASAARSCETGSRCAGLRHRAIQYAWYLASQANQGFAALPRQYSAIAGAAALLESAGFDRARVLKALRSTAVPLGPASWDPAYGFGLADVVAAWRSGGL